MNGGEGNDYIVAGDDSESDDVKCGDGYDVALVSGTDRKSTSLGKDTCEEVRNQ